MSVVTRNDQHGAHAGFENVAMSGARTDASRPDAPRSPAKTATNLKYCVNPKAALSIFSARATSPKNRRQMLRAS